jgi:hypothetical protein
MVSFLSSTQGRISSQMVPNELSESQQMYEDHPEGYILGFAH